MGGYTNMQPEKKYSTESMPMKCGREYIRQFVSRDSFDIHM